MDGMNIAGSLNCSCLAAFAACCAAKTSSLTAFVACCAARVCSLAASASCCAARACSPATSTACWATWACSMEASITTQCRPRALPRLRPLPPAPPGDRLRPQRPYVSPPSARQQRTRPLPARRSSWFPLPGALLPCRFPALRPFLRRKVMSATKGSYGAARHPTLFGF